MKILSIIKFMVTHPVSFVSEVCRRIQRFYKMHITKDVFMLEIARWFADKGDATLRLDYPQLDANSIVFDLGGYIGDFAEDIHRKYGCTVYVFEPHPNFFQKCIERFQGNDKIISLNYGISDENGEFELTDSENGSSFTNERKEGQHLVTCKVREFFQVMQELHVSHIDLMKINIEGGEFPLLEHIAKKDKLRVVNNYQVQFHNFVEGAVERRNKIVKSLSQSHNRTWCYEFVWENWQLR